MATDVSVLKTSFEHQIGVSEVLGPPEQSLLARATHVL
jgi:hypothetical protein